MLIAKLVSKHIGRQSGFLGASRLQNAFSSNKDLIEGELKKKLDLTYFAISDESAKHFEANDSHFSMYVVSDSFSGQTPIQRYSWFIHRHRLVKGVLKDAGIMNKVHAVSLKTHTVDEFKKNYSEKAEEILCRGGGKYEKKLAEQRAASSSAEKLK